MQGSETSKDPLWLTLAPWAFLFVWSAGYAAAKLGLQFTTPLNLLAFRFVGATLVLLPFILILRPSLPSRRVVLDLMAISFFLQIGHFGLAYTGMALGASAGIISLFAASQPMLIAIATGVYLRQIPHWTVWMGLILGLGGAAWVIWAQGSFESGVVIGAICGFGAVVGLSIGAVIEKARQPVCHPLYAYVIQYSFASLLSAPVAFASEGLNWSMDPSFLMALAYMVLGNSLVGIFIYLNMVRHGSIQRVTSIMFLVPGISAIIAWFVVDEVMPPLAWPGILIAAVGVILVIRQQKQA